VANSVERSSTRTASGLEWAHHAGPCGAGWETSAVLPGENLCRVLVDIAASSRKSRPLPAGVRSASKQAIGGSTFASVGHADMSDVVMNLRTGTRPRIFMQAAIRSSRPMIRRTDGAGVTSTRSPLTFPTPRLRLARYPGLSSEHGQLRPTRICRGRRRAGRFSLRSLTKLFRDCRPKWSTGVAVWASRKHGQYVVWRERSLCDELAQQGLQCARSI
jgi:hypothetical protein